MIFALRLRGFSFFFLMNPYRNLFFRFARVYKVLYRIRRIQRIHTSICVMSKLNLLHEEELQIRYGDV